MSANLSHKSSDYIKKMDAEMAAANAASAARRASSTEDTRSPLFKNASESTKYTPPRANTRNIPIEEPTANTPEQDAAFAAQKLREDAAKAKHKQELLDKYGSGPLPKR